MPLLRRVLQHLRPAAVEGGIRLLHRTTSQRAAYLLETRSDAEGTFTFAPIAPGRYWIRYDLVPTGGWGADTVKLTNY
jgi:hypothetical protein